MKDLYTIQFREGYNNCHIDGEESTDEWWFNKCGIYGEVDYNEDIIVKNDIIYTKEFNLGFILNHIGRFEANEEYDYITNQGYGQVSNFTRNQILGREGSWIVGKWAEDLEIKSYEQFAIDYPNFNKQEYQKLIDSLNHYYEIKQYLNE